MKKSKKQFSTHQGYTLVELLIVFALMALIGSLGIVSFINFNNSQTVDSAASEVANSYTIARQRALSQIKPPTCTTAQLLRGYEVTSNVSSRTYQVSALCGGNRIIISTKTLPPQVTFGPATPPSILFAVPNATVNTPGIATINGFGQSKQVQIDATGTISVR